MLIQLDESKPATHYRLLACLYSNQSTIICWAGEKKQEKERKIKAKRKKVQLSCEPTEVWQIWNPDGE